MAIASALELYQGPNAITSGAIPLRSPVVQGREGIDCVMLAGTPFWERTEVKDLLAYLRLAATLSDEVALARIINRPARAIGAKTVEKLQAWADAAGQSLCTALFGTRAVSVTLNAAARHFLPHSIFTVPCR